MTIAFALVERFSKSAPGKIDWNPKDLPPVPTANQRDTITIKRSEPIVGLIFGVIGLVIFNAMPWILGYVVASDQLVSIPVFNLEVLRSMLLLINLLICLGIVITSYSIHYTKLYEWHSFAVTARHTSRDKYWW